MPVDQLSGSLGRRRPALVVLCFVQYMLVLDDTVVSVALPSIKEDLGFGTTGLAWVANTYFLAFGGLLLLSGRAADLLGRRRVFLGGVALFGAASLVCGSPRTLADNGRTLHARHGRRHGESRRAVTDRTAVPR